MSRRYDVRPRWHQRLDRWAHNEFWRMLARGFVVFLLVKGALWLMK